MIEISPFAIDQASLCAIDLWEKSPTQEGFYSWLQMMVADAIRQNGCISPIYHKSLKMQVCPVVSRRGDGYLVTSVERAT